MSWDWRPEILLLLGSAGLFYGRGWRRLRRRGRGQLATTGRLIAYLAGLLVLVITLMSPLDVLAGWLFFLHMIQHILMLTIAPILLLLGDPFPFFIWGMPGGERIGRALFGRHAPFRRFLRQVMQPGVVWLTFVVFLWGWHDPHAYNAALRYPLLHDFQHLTFFLPGMMSWWGVIGAGPHLQRPLSPIVRVIYLLGTAAANAVPGVIIALSGAPIYTYYESVPRLWGISVMQDQVISGLIMWIPGTMMYLLAALFFVGRVMNWVPNPAGLRDLRGLEPTREVSW
ncbi:MAG: cytochrome c oxidase assembly protein [Chloroflexota bacterium]